MKKSLLKLNLLAMAGALMGVTPSATADPFVWTGASGTDLNWATAGNWNPSGPPGPSDDAQFFDDGATSDNVSPNNVAAADTTVESLWYGQTNGIHNTLINPGVTLTVQATNTSPDTLFAGTMTEVAVDTVVSNTIQGPGGTLTLDNPANILDIRQGFSGSGGAHYATLDLSGLDTFNANLQELRVGVGTSSSRRSEGHLFLAKTNVVTVRGTDGDPGLLVGDNSSNNNGNSRYSDITLGQENVLNADYIRIGGQKTQGRMYFADGLSSPSLTVRGSDGISRVTEIGIGDEHEQGSSGNPTTGTVDLSAGTADILADTLYVGRSQTANGREAIGNLTLAAGTLDVNTLELGYEDTSDNTRQEGNRTAEGNLTLNGTTVVVNDLFRMGREGGAVPTQIARLTMNGGTLVAPSVAVESTNCSITVGGGATLTVTDRLAVFGSPTMPLELFDLTGSTLNAPGNGGEISATSFNGSGATINISRVPPITQYPVALPLIHYVSGDFQTPTLGTLPSATPAFQGSFSNDLTGTIYLVLTDGPLTITLDWAGTDGGDWDTNSLNWLKSGSPAVYKQGDPVQFDDSASGTTNVNLTTTLTPSSLLVSNSAKIYTFAGPGSLSGGTDLDKEGDGTLRIENQGVNDFAGGITIGGGTLQVGDGTTNGNIPQTSIVNNGNFIFNRSDNFNLAGAVSGSGTLTKMGAGQLTLSGDTTYTGSTMIDGGTLSFGTSSFAGGGPITIGAGARLASLANTPSYILSPITSSGQVDPAGDGTPASLEVSSLTMNSGATLKFDFTDDLSASTPNDFLTVEGALTLNDNPIVVGFQGLPVTGIQYLILTAYGGITGSLDPSVVGTHYTATLDAATSPGSVYITFSGSGANMKWASTTNGIWSAGASNWLNLATSTMEPFYGGDSALLDDSVPGVVTNITIPDGTVAVAIGVTNDSSVNDYTITGNGSIGGPANVVKEGTSTLTLDTANSFTGTVEVRGGTLKTGSGSALGTTDAGTTIDDGATLDVNGQQLHNEPVTVAGAGVNGQGAVINSGDQQVNALGAVTVTGDTTFGGTGRWDIRGGGHSLSSASSTPYNLVKVGTNQVSLVGVTVDAYLNNVDVQEGTFAIQTSTIQDSSGFGDPAGTITVHTNASLNFWNLDNGGDNPLNKVIDILDGGILWSDSGSSTLIGPITTHGTGTLFCDGGTTLVISNVVDGAGGLAKTGDGTATLYGANTYSGDTRVTGGTMALAENGSISSSANIIVESGTLDVSGRTDGTLTLATGQTLGGSGTVTGNVVSGADTTVAPGASAGTLTVSGDVSLDGATVMEIDANTPANDKLVAANITFGGTLVVTNIGGPIFGTNVFDLFDGNLSQSFGQVILPNIAGVSWNTDNLTVDGTITAIGPAVNTTPVTLTAATADGQLTLSWPADHTGWKLQAQTNDLNTGLSANWFYVPGSGASNQTTIPIDPTSPSVFYRLVYP